MSSTATWVRLPWLRHSAPWLRRSTRPRVRRRPAAMWPLPGIPEVRAGDDIVVLILDAAAGSLCPGDIVVVTSKIVSKAEGRAVAATDPPVAEQHRPWHVDPTWPDRRAGTSRAEPGSMPFGAQPTESAPRWAALKGTTQ